VPYDAATPRQLPALVGRGVRVAVAIGVAMGVPVSAAACTGTSPISRAQSSPSSTPSATGSAGASPSGSASRSPSLGAIAAGAGSAQIPDIAARLQPSVVTIFVGQGLGSGVVYTADGLILTNEHVVRGATAVQVGFADGSRVTGTVRATDAVTDLALVQADRTNLPVPTYQTILPRIGDLDVVIGSPLGFENTVTAGIVSGLHREIPGSAAEGQALVELLQTDAAISPGNSGGAVVNGAGEVIGVSEAYIPPSSGAVSLGFAIPAATVVDVAEQLRTNGRAEHAFAGIEQTPITPQIANQLGLPNTDGAVVLSVVRAGPADQAGMRPGDVLTAFDGKPVRTPEDFLAALRPHRPGDVVTATVRRGTQTQQLSLTLAGRPAAANQQPRG
jgi:serine protease DegQ